MLIYNVRRLGTPAYEKGMYDHRCRNILVSYAVRSTRRPIMDYWYNKPDVKVFLDSGAFSVLNSGATIDLDEYCAFIESKQKHLEVYACLDVIGDHVGTKKNQQYMEAKGLHPLPVFHYGTPFRELGELCEKYDYFALGGLVPLAPTQLMKHLNRCFSIIMRYFPKKVHLFGITRAKVLEKYPIYSADSAAVEMAGGMGRVNEFNGRSISAGRMTCLLDEYKDDRSERSKRCWHNIAQIAKLERYITDLWAERGVIW